MNKEKYLNLINQSIKEPEKSPSLMKDLIDIIEEDTKEYENLTKIKEENKMNIYQKAIKVRKVCENTLICNRHKGKSKCPYFSKCKVSELLNSPCFESIEILANVIIKEKWNVK